MAQALQVANSLVKLLKQHDRVGALALLKDKWPTLTIGGRQRLVNNLQKELRERNGVVNVTSLAGELMLNPPSGVSSLSSAPSHSTPLTPEGSTAARHIFGDSHTHILASVQCRTHEIYAYPFVAGSAMGLHHADSRSGYRSVLEGDLARVSRGDSVVFKFGQVDVDFVYYLKLANDPRLEFDTFAAESVSKYMSFVLPALDRFGIERTRFFLMTPNPTVVTDPFLRESLCTLPFMAADFKTKFKARLDSMLLPNMRIRTCYGRRYCELLMEEASKHNLQVINVYDCLLGSDGTAASPNDDAQHHLLGRHLSAMLPVLDQAFGAVHTQSIASALETPPAEPKATLDATAMEWLKIYTEVMRGERPLALQGHVRCSYAQLEASCGRPMRTSTTPEGPNFASWLLRFKLTQDGATLPGLGIVVHVKGRFVAACRCCVWEVEAASEDGVSAVDMMWKLAEATLHPGVVDALPVSVKAMASLQRSSPQLFHKLIHQLSIGSTGNDTGDA